MNKYETLFKELAKTTLNCLENQSDIFLTFRYSPDSKILDLDIKLPDKSEDTLSVDIAILFYLLISGQHEEILQQFILSSNNPIIQKASKELENMMQNIIDEENNKSKEVNGIKFMPDGSIDPISVIQLQEDGL